MDEIIIPDSLKEKLTTAKTLEDVVRYCNEEGIQVTIEQLNAYASSDEELSEEALDSVDAGCGCIPIGRIWRLIPWIIPRPRPIPSIPRLFLTK